MSLFLSIKNNIYHTPTQLNTHRFYIQIIHMRLYICACVVVNKNQKYFIVVMTDNKQSLIRLCERFILS